MKTSGSFDCSSALVIRSINYQQMLPQTGRREIDLGISRALNSGIWNEVYNFVVNFN